MSFTKGILASAVVSATLVGIAGTAQATTATVSSSKTITKTSSSSASKKTRYGTFGAGYSAGYTLYSNDTGTSKYESANATITATLFSKDFTLAKATGKLSAGTSTSVTKDYVLTAGGYDFATVTGAVFDTTSSASGSWGELSLDINSCLTLAEAKENMVIVVVPVTATLEATGCPDMYLKAAATYSSSQSSINTTIAPSFEVDLSGSVGVGTEGYSAGIETDITLIKLSLPVVNSMSFVPSTKVLTYTTAGTLTLDSLDGSIGLYAKAWPFKYTYTLFSWSGVGGSWLLFSDSIPTASGAQATISNAKAKGTYAYLDPSSVAESGSSYLWSRASDVNGAGSTDIGNTQDWSLVPSDSGKYLRFCVTPQNTAHNPGTQACSSWMPVGHLMELYQDDSYGGSNVNVAYEPSISGTCMNLTDSSFNDAMSSFQFFGPTSTSSTLWIFKDIDCSGGSKSFSVAANGSYSTTSIHTTLDDSWNDKVTSFMVISGETVSAEDVTATVSANKATGAYTFVSNSDLSEGSSTYYWRRASSSTGAGATTISNSNSASYTLTTSDSQMYLSFCVTPTNGYTTGSNTCSDWTSVGHLVELFKDGSYGNTSVVFAYEKSSSGTCFNLPDYSFNDAMSSFKFYSPTSSTATLWVSYDGSCSGNTATYTAQANSSYLMSSVNSYWNDSASSFRVTW